MVSCSVSCDGFFGVNVRSILQVAMLSFSFGLGTDLIGSEKLWLFKTVRKLTCKVTKVLHQPYPRYTTTYTLTVIMTNPGKITIRSRRLVESPIKLTSTAACLAFHHLRLMTGFTSMSRTSALKEPFTLIHSTVWSTFLHQL